MYWLLFHREENGFLINLTDWSTQEVHIKHLSWSSFPFFSLQVAKSLFNDECLKPCPRCQHPARCHSVKGEGVCSRADCAFQFCTACLCAFHGSKECGSQSGGRRKKDILLPGSAQSKRNIRRLWTEITVSVCFVSVILLFFFFFGSLWRWGLAMRKRIYSRYMRATSVLINVSMCLSVIFTLFFSPM